MEAEADTTFQAAVSSVQLDAFDWTCTIFSWPLYYFLLYTPTIPFCQTLAGALSTFRASADCCTESVAVDPGKHLVGWIMRLEDTCFDMQDSVLESHAGVSRAGGAGRRRSRRLYHCPVLTQTGLLCVTCES